MILEISFIPFLIRFWAISNVRWRQWTNHICWRQSGVSNCWTNYVHTKSAVFVAASLNLEPHSDMTFSFPCLEFWIFAFPIFWSNQWCSTFISEVAVTAGFWYLFTSFPGKQKYMHNSYQTHCSGGLRSGTLIKPGHSRFAWFIGSDSLQVRFFKK